MTKLYQVIYADSSGLPVIEYYRSLEAVPLASIFRLHKSCTIRWIDSREVKMPWEIK